MDLKSKRSISLLQKKQERNFSWKWFAFFLSSLFYLNLFDAWATLYVVRAGVVWEINPLMRLALDQGDFFFVFVKVLLVSLGGLILWYGQAWRTIIALNLVYLLVCLWHFANFLALYG